MYTVKEIAEIMYLTEHTVRYYTDKGLLPCKRDSANRRLFDEEAINWLTGIKCLKGCGMSIEAIKKYTDLCLEGDATLEARYQIILEQKALAEARLKEAQETFDYMESKAKHYKDVINRQVPDDTNPNNWKIGSLPADCK